MKFQEHVGGLRALAVIFVILYHFAIPGFNGGYVGVDIFLVISGYLMADAVVRGSSGKKFSYANFYLRRLRRVAPALIVMVLAATVWAFVFLLPANLVQFLKSATSALHYGSNFHYAKDTGYFEATDDLRPLIHTWSLALEAQFYLIFPLLIVPFLKFGKYYKAQLLVLLAVSFALCVYLTPVMPEKAFYLLPTRLWEFLAGALLVVIANGRFKSRVFTMAGLIMIFASVVLFSNSTSFPGYAAALPVIGACLVIAAGSKLLSHRVLQFTGDISYSLYLWHWPLYVAAKYHFQTLTPLHITGLMVVLVVISYASYRYIEQPFRQNKKFWSNAKLLVIVLTALLLVLGLKIAAKNNHGFAGRMPDYVMRAAQIDKYQSQRQKECFRNLDGKKAAREDYCKMGAGNPEVPPNILLWGDSHADHLHMMLNDLLVKAGRKGQVATFGNCPPTPGIAGEEPFEDDKLNSKHGLCAGFNQDVAGVLAKGPFETVIIALNWERYKPAFMKQNLEKLVCETLKNKTVIIVGQVPIPPANVPNSWALTQLQEGRAIEQMQTPQSPALNFEDAMPACENVKVLDPQKYLCENGQCYLVRAGNALYSDESHLTRAGAGLLAEPMREILFPVPLPDGK